MGGSNTPRHSRRRIAVFAVCLAGLLGLAAAGAYVGAAWWIRNRGITLQPARVRPPADVAYFLQNDPAWANALMAPSSDRLGGSGCLVCSLATALTALGTPTDPAKLNDAFVRQGVYDDLGQVVWPLISVAFPGVTYHYQRVFTSATIERDLEQGLLPILKVHYLGGSAPHWMAVVGASAQDFLVMDPLNTARGPLPLSKHGKVYAYRVLRRR